MGLETSIPMHTVSMTTEFINTLAVNCGKFCIHIVIFCVTSRDFVKHESLHFRIFCFDSNLGILGNKTRVKKLRASFLNRYCKVFFICQR